MRHTSRVSFTVGQVVDHYRLDGVVAESPALTVFAAFDLRLLRRVALKALGADLGANGAFRARFAFEAAAAAQLDHPGIVSVYDSNEHDGSLYFVTKFIDGVSLDRLLKSRPVSIAEAMIYLEQLAGALDYAHRHGVVHGDVRPATVLVDTSEEPHAAVLFDVGIAKAAPEGDEPDAAALFGPGAVERSPALTRADPDGRRTDLVGLARTAFELLTRRAPQDALVSAAVLSPQLPAAIDGVFAEALGVDGHDMTCTHFVGALRRVLPPEALVYRPVLAPGSSLPAPVVVQPEVLPTAALVAAAASVGSDGSAGQSSSRRIGVTLAAVAAVGVLMAGAIVWSRGSPSTQAGGRSSATLPPPTFAAPTIAVGPSPTTVVASTVAPTTTAPSPPPATPATTEAATTVATTAPAPAPPAPAPVNQYGDLVGQPITQPQNPEGIAAMALQERLPPNEVADADTPIAYYAEWLRLTTSTPDVPVVASAEGYLIDAGTPADISSVLLGDDGRPVDLVECTAAGCTPLSVHIETSPDCAPGPECNAFATDDETVLAVLRAIVTLRAPAITLMFAITSRGQPIVGVSDPNNTVRYDGQVGMFSITLAAAPPDGTESAITVTYLDGTRSKMTISYG